MDEIRFDSIARAMAQGFTRRRALTALAGAVAGALAGGRTEVTAQAQSPCPPGQIPNRKGECHCPAGTEPCPNGCYDRKRDPSNCGACGNVCPTGADCRKGECRCPTGLIACNGACVDPRSDSANCGGCGSICPTGHTCSASGRSGVCTCTPRTCESLGVGCGTFEDGCGRTIRCTNCPSGQICDGVACRLLNGSSCTAGADCASGYCVGSVCCDQPCPGECSSCTTGTCTALSGTMCGGDGICGGTCAAGACVYPDDTTVCAGQTCTGPAEATTWACDGAGACAPTPVTCGLFTCEDGACQSTCQSDDDCIGAAFCTGGTCQGDLPDGASCTGDDQCMHGHCVDGVCCDTACDGQCEACDLSPAGTCAPFLGNPRGHRPACTGGVATVCSGFCNGINRETCTYAAAGMVCNAGICTDNVLDAGTFCDGAGACVPSQSPDANCSPYLCDPSLPTCPSSCGNDADCIGGFQCIADSGGVGRCVQPRGLGERCAEPGDCLQGFGCYERSTGSPICCPIPGCGPCQELDATCQCVPIPGSDGQTCGSDRICCSGQCCVTDATCAAGQCSETCIGLFGTCENDGQCCSSEFAICEAIYPSPTTKCCSTLGGPCIFPLGDCCDVPGELDTSARRVFCAVEGNSTCGGVGAVCSSPTLPGDLEPSRQCVSGTCCLNEAGDSGVCCDFGQECDENLRCRTHS